MQADASPQDPFSLKGKVALVTGGIRGIGAAVSRALAAAGALVAVTSRPTQESQEQRRALESELAEVGVAARAFGCDLEVRSQASIDACVAAVTSNLGPIDVLVNNAGTNVQQDALDVDEATWDLIVDTNLKGLFFMSQAVARGMSATPRADDMGYSIVNVASQMGLVGLSRRAAYCSSKAGVVNLTRVLAIEWARYGIRVNAWPRPSSRRPCPGRCSPIPRSARTSSGACRSGGSVTPATSRAGSSISPDRQRAS